MLNKIAIFAAAAILAAPICAAAGGSSSGGGSSTGTSVGGGVSSAGGNSAGGSAGGHSGGGGDVGHGGGASGGVAHSGGLGGGAAAATARSVAYGHELSSHGGIPHADAMHATHLPGVNHSEGEHTASKLPNMDHHNRCSSYRCEPNYRAPFNQQLIPACVPGVDMNNKWSWFDCNGPTKSQSGHKS
jgi:hypothetical protein